MNIKLLWTVLHQQFGNCRLYLAANFPVGANTQTVKFQSAAKLAIILSRCDFLDTKKIFKF